ncbi:MAG: sigma 54-interacting transcriptional regulator [Hyphomicrobiaceae bacterium]|nr:sigma 54-interacting transcriptional regulator [Hyphomicrobiaceae bacterium]
MPLLASGLENVKAAALFSGSLGGLHVATQAALHSGFAWTRELKPCRSVQPAMAYRPTTHRSKKETAAGTDHGDALASDTLADAFECCLVAIVRDGRSFIHLTMIDLRAFYRRSDDDAADTLHRAGLPEWRRAESFFREIEQRHRLILSAAGEGIFGVDANGITTFVNPAAERMLGFKASEVIGRQMHSVVHHKHADGSHYPVEQCPIYNAFRAKTINTIDDEVFWRKDGKPVRVEYTSTPLVDNGTAVGAVIIFRDISERKQQEDTLRRALEENATLRERLEKENAYLQEEILTKSNHNEILGTSEATLRILRQIDVVAATDANVLITGESGTGKELVAGALHQASDRRTRPLIRVNCAAIPRELFESEFFGHVKGAFSGAIRDRVGRFELADGGTLFLDEVGEIPLDLQSKLLRVLQEGCFERVGQERTRKVDVRIIAATNRDLKSEVEKGRFREDLFFRLNVFPIECSPLRHRREDIALLARHFLRMSCRRINVPEPRISRADVESLEAYAWPGNARELQNVMERAAILSRNGRLNLNLPSGGKSSVKPADPVLPRSSEESRILTAAEMEALEIRNIESAIEACDGRVSGPMGAAHLLEMNAQTLYSRLRKLKSSRISRA